MSEIVGLQVDLSDLWGAVARAISEKMEDALVHRRQRSTVSCNASCSG